MIDVCTIENVKDYKITHDITMLNKDSFIKLIHMAASLRDSCRIQITPQHNWLKSRTTPKLGTVPQSDI